MITKRVEVTIYKPFKEVFDKQLDRFIKEFGNLTDDYDSIDFAKFDDVIENTHVFYDFTNSGKLSKQDGHYRKELAPFAEKELSKLIALENQTILDQNRANELAEKINKADFENEKLISIKTKMSHSEWYSNGGAGHGHTMYYTCVPEIVVDEAEELQNIRKKHQGNQEFDFFASDYKKVVVRDGDHENYKGESVSIDDLKIYSKNGKLIEASY